MCSRCQSRLYINGMRAHLREPGCNAERFIRSVLKQAEDRQHITPGQASAVRRLVSSTVRARYWPGAEAEAGVRPLSPDGAADLEAGRQPPAPSPFAIDQLVVTMTSGEAAVVREQVYLHGRQAWKYRVMVFEQGVVGRTMVSRNFYQNEIREPTSTELPRVTRAYMEGSGAKEEEEVPL